MTERVRPKDPAAAAAMPWGSIQWLVSGELTPGATVTFGYVEIAAGAKNPLMRHPNCDEVLYLLDGELEHSVEGEVFRLKPGDAIHIPRGAKHDARNPGSVAARMVVAYDTGERQIEILDQGRD
jgi:quercetin dioxygenase-like cupin family protein